MMVEPAAIEPLRTPLHSLHLALGARMIGFAGYDMPLHYPTGILTEHVHTRSKAGLFDVSHMGQAILSGRYAAARLEALVPGDIDGLRAGHMRYTQLLNDDGNILDDLMVTKLTREGDRLLLVVNAGTKTADFAAIARALPDLHLEVLNNRGLIALQGPMAAQVLARQLPHIASMPFLSLANLGPPGAEIFVSRSGYTGEDGFEISLANDGLEAFAKRLLAEPEVAPCGLGARDSLRLEAGLCLYGHDITTTTTPIEAGLTWSIGKRRQINGGFVGEARVRLQIAQGSNRRRIGLLLEGRAPAREGAQMTTLEGLPIGHVTSGGFSPTLGQPIAMGYIEATYAAPGTRVHLMVRGKPLAATVTKMPFVPTHYYRSQP